MRWKWIGEKMKMRWKWQWDEKLPNQDAKRGNADAEGRRKHQHMKPSPKRATLERQGKRNRRPTENGTRPAEEGEDRSAWTNLTRRKPTTTSARNGPNLPGGRRTQEHMKKDKKGTHGELVKEMMHPQRMQCPLVWVQRPRIKSTLWTAVSVQPLN